MSQQTLIRLRYPATCSVCGAQLPVRSEAQWDRAAKEATCRACVEGPPELDRGEAGASAARRFERLHQRRESHAREQYGRFGGIYLALTDDPQSTKAWDTGSRGERALGRFLETLHDGNSIVVLHDRRIPGTRANIDHVVVAPSGIFVIDAKNYTGKVQRVDRGGWFSIEWRLIVGRRDCTKLVHGMTKQAAAIEAAVGDPAIAVHPAICFVAAEWSLLARPFEIAGVWIGWPTALAEWIQSAGPIRPEHARMIAERLAAALPAA